MCMEKTALLQSVVTLNVHGEDCIVIASRYLECAWRRLHCYSQSEWEERLFRFMGAADVRNGAMPCILAANKIL